MKNNIEKLKNVIEYAYKNQSFLSAENTKITMNDRIIDVGVVVRKVIRLLNIGQVRVAEKIDNAWIVHQWLKKAVLLGFRVMNSQIIRWGEKRFFDKVFLKFSHWEEENFKKENIRLVPPATIRYGSYIAPNVVIMPSYINIGAYIDTGTMIDTWATIGSCAQIGKNVHLSGGVGIGGVLEPLQSAPTIIEDDCFIGARSEIVEGVIVEKGSVVSMGVFIGQSTKIYDCENGNIYYGRVPSGSVVIPGTLPYRKLNSEFNIYCALIIKKVDMNTRRKTSINELLRGIK